MHQITTLYSSNLYDVIWHIAIKMLHNQRKRAGNLPPKHTFNKEMSSQLLLLAHTPTQRVNLLEAILSHILEETYSSFPANNCPLSSQSSASCVWPEKEERKQGQVYGEGRWLVPLSLRKFCREVFDWWTFQNVSILLSLWALPAILG